MFSVSINGSDPLKTSLNLNGESFSGTLNNKAVEGSLIKLNNWQFHLLYNSCSYNVEVVKLVPEDKSMVVKINGVKLSLALKDKYDELLHTLGLDDLAAKKVSDVKAPMPGMVLSVLVQEGLQVKKGDALIVLEAMKMENILKSPGDGTIKKVVAVKGKAVEKNEILIQF